jgi:hypothetical protein
LTATIASTERVRSGIDDASDRIQRAEVLSAPISIIAGERSSATTDSPRLVNASV